MNKRKYLRAPLFLDGLLSSSEESRQVLENIKIKNIGKGGALISSAIQFNKGDEFSLIVELNQLPRIDKTWKDCSESIKGEDFLRVSLCRIGELRDIKKEQTNISYTYSLIFNELSFEATNKIEKYVCHSKKIIEYLMTLNSHERSSNSNIFFQLTDNLEWFSGSNNPEKLINSFYKDLTWG